ncbi:TetR/AcrR family transcriptional regulator [Aliiroseovarius sp. KMU-50]|uniref:TetR/AcrR family transcriptional regulator n=1 Tax=Aliiroseovarius salicola TaxID=3009082 RepID=A0ABT4VZS2_9RHOB|nr:TetR/AcrR family transcriptional regulator [Aliiroseovarius sp. KMU-50]MDA5093711.1 TetR/AcrR family transcriptional regulator [Aliiroseovarius sp. KMU-50]
MSRFYRGLRNVVQRLCSSPSGKTVLLVQFFLRFLMAKPGETRQKILNIAQDAVLSKGFAATSIDEIVAAAEVTRSGFFYYFKDKNALARALLERYVESEDALFDELFDRSRELHEDPLHAMLIGLKLLSEMMGDLPSAHPGCLVATTCYQDQLFDGQVREVVHESFSSWRKRFAGYFREIGDLYPPRETVDYDELGDMVNCVVEGGLILSRAYDDPSVLAGQIMHLRRYVKFLFAPVQH